MKDMIDGIVGSAVDLFKSYFPPDMSDEQKAQFAQNEQKLRADMNTLIANSAISLEQEVTKRAQADMSSDSWLAKNIRPLLMLILIFTFIMFAIASIKFQIGEEYVGMLKEMLMAAFSFYFAGRTIEKVTSLITSNLGNKKS